MSHVTTEVKYAVPQDKPRKYPYAGIFAKHGYRKVVWFTEPGTGILISPDPRQAGDNINAFGLTMSSWAEYDFEEFFGSVTINFK